MGARRKAFAKLDTNGNGSLSFEEWTAKTIGKFRGADANYNGWLTAPECAATAPPQPKKSRCAC
jgi:EF hand domain-containing protein